MNKLKMGGLILGGFMGAVATGIGGFLFRPRPFARPHGGTINKMVRLPTGLPEPVKRHYAQAFQDGLPAAETAVFTGRAWFRMTPEIDVQMRMRFAAYHWVGRSFLRQMEVTWFNIPFLKGKDSYIDQVGAMDINGQLEKGSHINQGANMVMWCEALILPSALLNDRLHWSAVDEHTARLEFPFEDGFDRATLRFDPATGLMQRFSGWRHKTQESGKVMWHVDYLNWQNYSGMYFPKQISVQWADEETAWFTATMDDFVLNVELPAEMMEGNEESTVTNAKLMPA